MISGVGSGDSGMEDDAPPAAPLTPRGVDQHPDNAPATAVVAVDDVTVTTELAPGLQSAEHTTALDDAPTAATTSSDRLLEAVTHRDDDDDEHDAEFTAGGVLFSPPPSELPSHWHTASELTGNSTMRLTTYDSAGSDTSATTGTSAASGNSGKGYSSDDNVDHTAESKEESKTEGKDDEGPSQSRRRRQHATPGRDKALQQQARTGDGTTTAPSTERRSHRASSSWWDRATIVPLPAAA